MAENENIEATPEEQTPESIQQNGIPVITMELNAASVIPNAVDATLQNSGEAADAKVVGDRLEAIDLTLNTAAENIEDLQADMTGLISEGGTIDQLDGKIDSTKAEVEQDITNAVNLRIPKTDISTTLTEAGKVADAKAVGDAISAMSGDNIPYSTGDTNTVKDTVDDIVDRVATLEQISGDDIPAGEGDTETVGTAIDRLDTAIDSLENRTANEILYTTGGDTIKTKVDEINGAMPFAVHFNENLNVTRVTFNDSRITEDHVVASLTARHPADILWTTSARALVLECQSGIPELDLVLCIPATNN